MKEYYEQSYVHKLSKLDERDQLLESLLKSISQIDYLNDPIIILKTTESVVNNLPTKENNRPRQFLLNSTRLMEELIPILYKIFKII